MVTLIMIIAVIALCLGAGFAIYARMRRNPIDRPRDGSSGTATARDNREEVIGYLVRITPTPGSVPMHVQAVRKYQAVNSASKCCPNGIAADPDVDAGTQAAM